MWNKLRRFLKRYGALKSPGGADKTGFCGICRFLATYLGNPDWRRLHIKLVCIEINKSLLRETFFREQDGPF